MHTRSTFRPLLQGSRLDVENQIRMLRVVDSVRCGCGDWLTSGERAGSLEGHPGLLCLWCLADIKAGRSIPRRRMTSTPPVGPPIRTTSYRQQTPRRARRGVPSTAASLLVAVLVVSGALWAKGNLTKDTGTAIAGVPVVPNSGADVGGGSIIPVVPAEGARSSWPPIPNDAAGQPLGHPPAQASRSQDYAFMDRVGGTDSEPVRFDPCRPIHVVVNSAAAPAGADKLLRRGLAEISRTTGLRFVLEGETTEAPVDMRPPSDRGQYGNRWSPVLVAWSDPRSLPGLRGRVAGLAGPVGAPYSTTRDKHWVSGQVYLDGPTFDEILTRPDGWWHAEAIVLHELAHLVGLTHVSATSQLMHADNAGVLTFGEGDLEGLRRLGDGPCFS